MGKHGPRVCRAAAADVMQHVPYNRLSYLFFLGSVPCHFDDMKADNVVSYIHVVGTPKRRFGGLKKKKKTKEKHFLQTHPFIRQASLSHIVNWNQGGHVCK